MLPMREYVRAYYDILTESKTDNNYYYCHALCYNYIIIIIIIEAAMYLEVLYIGTYNILSIIYMCIVGTRT